MSIHPLQLARCIYGLAVLQVAFAGGSTAVQAQTALPSAKVLDALTLVVDVGPEAGARELELLLRGMSPAESSADRGAVLWGLAGARLQMGEPATARELASTGRLLWQSLGDSEWSERAGLQVELAGFNAGSTRVPVPFLRAGYLATLAKIEAQALRLDDALLHVDTAIREMEALEPLDWAAEMAAGLRIGRAAIFDLYQDAERAAHDLDEAVAILEQSPKRHGIPDDQDPLPGAEVQLRAVQEMLVGDPKEAIRTLTELRRSQPDALPPGALEMLDLLARMETNGSREVVAYCRAAKLTPPAASADPQFVAARPYLCAMVDSLADMESRNSLQPDDVCALLRTMMEMMNTAPGPFHEDLSRMLLEMLDLLDPPSGPESWPSTEELLEAVRAGREVYASVPPSLRESADSTLVNFIQLATRVRARAGDAAGALAISEQARARVLQDRLLAAREGTGSEREDSAPLPDDSVELPDPDLERALELRGLAEGAMHELRAADALRYVEQALALVEGKGEDVLEAGLLAYRGAILATLQETEHSEEDMKPFLDLLSQEVSRRTPPGGPDLTPLVAVLPALLLSYPTRPEVGLEQLQELKRLHEDVLPPYLSTLVDAVSALQAEHAEEAEALCQKAKTAVAESPDPLPGPMASTLDMLCSMTHLLASMSDNGPVDPEALKTLFQTADRTLQNRDTPFGEPLSMLLGQMSEIADTAESPDRWPSSEELQRVLESQGDAISKTAPAPLRAGLDDAFSPLPQVAVMIRSQAGDAAGAFELAEQARSRELLDRLGAHAPGERGNPERQREIARLRARRDALTTQIEDASWSEPDSPGAERLRGELRQVENDLANAFIRVALENPNAERVEPLSTHEVQRALGDDTTLVAYLTFPLGDEPLAWVVDRDDVHLVHLSVEEEDLERDAQRFNQILRHGLPADELAEHLYQVLWARLAPRIATRRVLVVPHGPLQDVPFGALRDPSTGHWLVEQATLSYAPSASAWARLRAREPEARGPAMILGDPAGDLPTARSAAREVASFWQVSPRVGVDATEGALRAAVASAPLIHLSAHAVVSESDPLLSYLKLAPSAGGDSDPRLDGRLELHEVVEELDLSGTSLVVLAACQSAAGPRTRGDEVTSLARAFLLAGARSVISTSWPVEDDDAGALMVDFHRHLSAGMESAEALRMAQEDAIHSPERANPAHWAAFALHGVGGVIHRPAQGTESETLSAPPTTLNPAQK